MVYELVPELKDSQRGYLKSEKFPFLKTIIFIGQEKHRGMFNTAELILLGSQLDDTLFNSVQSTISCYDVVNMQYTSGTTGFPKGVMLTHHNILNNGLATGQCMNFTADDRLCVCVPLFHCFGCVLALCSVITHGSTMVMVENFDPLVVLASVQKEKCTALYGVPTMFISELNHPMFNMFDLSSLRTGIMAGSVCPIETMNEVMSKMNMSQIIIVYGLTESSPGMTATRTYDPPAIRSTTVGKAYPAVEVKVADPETGIELKPGEQGELCCKGYNVMKGYYNNPEATAKAIDAEGWLHSGDLGVMDEDGYFRVTGRIKDMIIRGGENVYPREIENYLYTMPQIQAVEVVGVASPKYGEEVGAFIKKRQGAELTEEDVIDYCRGKIARFKIPKYIFFIDEYPMTASGKIQKYKLRQMSLELLKEKGVVPA
jgi:fatty-acyl-CoA synthase